MAIYKKARDYAGSKGIIIADTKFEFGTYEDEIILIDEVITPDSSRFWPSSEYDEGTYKTPFWYKYLSIQIFFKWFRDKFGGDIHRVNLVRMCPGGSVKKHIDGGRYYKDKDRFHFVIQGEYEYTVNKESMVYKQGVWG